MDKKVLFKDLSLHLFVKLFYPPFLSFMTFLVFGQTQYDLKKSDYFCLCLLF